MLLADFRKLMDDIPHEDHALPKAFRPVGAIKRNEKPVLSLESSEKIEDLWRDYCALSSFLESQACLPGGSELARFSRQDYTRLMRIFCHSLKPDEAATRILTIQCDLQNRGIKLTRKLYGMVAQANIISGSIPESTRLYHEAAVMLEPGSLEHKLLLLTLIDTFVANRCASEGIAFLDQVPLFDPKIEDPVRYMHSLYRKLYLYKSREELKQGPKSPLPEDLALIKEFLARPIPPQSPYIRRTLSQLEEFNNDNTILPGVKDPIHIFSKSVSGMILKCSKKGAQSVTPILRSLLQRGHLEEATRVLDMTLQYSEVPDMDQLRFSLLRLLNTDVEKKRLMSIIVQWDAITAMRSNNISSERSLIQPPIEEPQSNRWGKEYSKFIQICIQRDYLEGAINAATYMSKRGWVAQGLDFKKLNSFMVNLGQSSDYTSYIEVRYALGGSVAPDLHSFRRLIYAACRRSDLFSAVSLFHIARTRHLDWTFDSSFYNAIISTAGVIGEVRVAEKTFAQLLKDGVEPDLISFHGLLNGYGQAKDLEAAIMIPKQMRKHNLNPTTKTFNLVMKAYLVGRKDMTTSRKLFKVMQLSGVGGVPPDLVTFNQLLEGYRRVGNTTWFDAYFDRYFGSRHDVTDEKPTFIRPEKPDDWTLLIQLKHSLYLPGIDLLTVQELWHTMKPKLLSQSLPISPPANPNDPEGPFSFVDSTDDANDDPSTVSEAVTNLEDSLPATHVPFQRRLGDVFVPATDRDYFRFTTLSLFRSIFEKHGDNAGVKTIDTILAEFFPTHPMGREVHYRRLIKKSRHLTKLKKRAEVIQQTKEEKKKKRLIEVMGKGHNDVR
ncbi:hypothetical protein BGX27_004871 [Mortierella sp. AM989]|nr:hypothetical protein BGX27_004871 [Mortierella sp. AM989]